MTKLLSSLARLLLTVLVGIALAAWLLALIAAPMAICKYCLMYLAG